MPSAAKRLPAYGRELLTKRRRGLVPANRTVFVVDRFDFPRTQHGGWHCVVRPEDDPAVIDFSFVAGLEVMVVTRDGTRLEEIAEAIKSYKPKRLVGASSDPAQITVFVAA